MEKLYVISQNSQYHLKVENDAIPISQVLEQRKAVLSSESGTLSAGSYERVCQDMRVREIQDRRDDILGSAIKESGYGVVNGQVWEYRVWFLLKQGGDSLGQGSPRKGKQGSLRKQIEDGKYMNMEALIEENMEYDQIYIEIADK